jgi:phosphoglycerate dehydrogenase-like enzyme
VRRPVASSALCFLLALAHKLPAKDRLTRAGRWADRMDHQGIGLAGRTLGVIGLGNIGREVFRLAAPLEMRHVGHDPHVPADQAAAVGILWLGLDELLAAADFVVVCCALTAQTHHLLDARRLARMRSTSYLINVARGPIVDQAALTRVLQEKRIAGAALDVFEQEPIDPRDPLLSLDNVILAPHAICWTDECFLGNGRSACQSIVDFASGRVPKHVVNREVLNHPALRGKLAVRRTDS